MQLKLLPKLKNSATIPKGEGATIDLYRRADNLVNQEKLSIGKNTWTGWRKQHCKCHSNSQPWGPIDLEQQPPIIASDATVKNIWQTITDPQQ